MKKLIIALLVLAASTSQASAALSSDDRREDVIFGLKAGLNLSNVYDESGDAFVADAKLGFAAGAFLTLPLGELFAIQPEFLFSQKGFKATGNLLGYSYGLTRTSNYLDIPIFFAARPSSFLSVMAGPQFSYLMKQRDVVSSGPNSTMQEQEFQNENIRKNTLCFVGGLDLNFHPIVLGLRAGWDIRKNNGDGTSQTPRYKNVWYQATLGIAIN